MPLALLRWPLLRKLLGADRKQRQHADQQPGWRHQPGDRLRQGRKRDVPRLRADLPALQRHLVYRSLRAGGRTAAGRRPAQKKAFSKAFQGYISRKYGKRFREFIGGKLEVTGVKRVKKWYEVSTIAYLKGQSPFEVTFLVSDRSGRDLFFNMFIEGVNLLLTERTEIGAILDRNKGDIDALIAELEAAELNRSFKA